ncbi:calcium/sodium antiporter [Desulfobotulus sp. H1]|uniref:Calcium/sodium antiporter n=1 Tax=Desulfobotulus pelophilus TaxID=2823377 RepID=A0ABT3N6C8_9BACT|nr:calcium/sodium antiporter [Desulfobotulus pelophilus]MCW7753025.1 calcium/sodium antiporter [Desulfobotulus pelophilus]
MSMLWAWAALGAGLIILVMSADLFVDGAAALARKLGMSPLLIGMVIVGFGTSAPEMLVSAMASMDGQGGLALGNAYGSNIANIALILGLTAIIRPIPVTADVLRRALPVLMLVTLLAVVQLMDLVVSRSNAAVLLVTFVLLMYLSISGNQQEKSSELRDLSKQQNSTAGLTFRLVLGLTLLIASSRMLVWGAVSIAEVMGISDLMIGLTIVALGTSLPELASSLAAARKGEDAIALGNILGSNLFNTLIVVGIAGIIRPVAADPMLLTRDLSLMTALTFSLFILGYGFRKPGNISRLEGILLVLVYISYTGWLIHTVLR